MLFHNHFNHFFLNKYMIRQCRRHTHREREGGSRYKLPRPDYVAYAFILLGSLIICQLYKLTIADQAQVTL